MSLRTFTVLFVVTFSSCAFSFDIPGDELLKYFGATCRSQGEWTKAALSDTEGLILALDEIKNDGNCTGASHAVASLNNLQTTITELERRNSVKLEIEKLKAQEIELLKQLNSASDPALAYELETAIRDVQVQKASLLAEESSKDSLRGEAMQDIYSRIVSSSNQVFYSLTSNQLCLNKNPGLLQAATSLTSSLASAAYTLNPAIGLGLAASTDFMGAAIDSFRKGWFNRRVRKLSQNTFALEGYLCAMESLTDRWCELRDAEHFIDFKALLKRQTNEESGLASAVRINDRDLPVLLNWLNAARAGVPASSSAAAERQRNVFNREASVRSAEALGNGVISENRPLFDSLPAPQDKYSVVKSVITKLTNTQCGGGMFTAGGESTPLSDIYSNAYAPYYLLGLDSIPTRGGGVSISFCEFDPFNDWPSGSYSPDFELLKNRYMDWIAKARARVNRELALVLQPDALQALTSAFERTGNKWKISTFQALTNIEDFLLKFRPEFFINSSYEKLYSDTVTDLSYIKSILESTVVGDNDYYKEALEEIYNAAELQYGTIVIQTRLEMATRIALDRYFQQLDEENVEIASQMLAADTFLETLQKISGTDNLGSIKAEVKRAQRITLSNMSSFANVFGENINDILEKNFTRSRGEDTLVAEVYRRNVGEICVLLSSLPEWPNEVDKSYCEGAMIPEVIPGGPASVRVDAAYLVQSYSKRECGYRDYMRKTKIYQDWGIRF